MQHPALSRTRLFFSIGVLLVPMSLHACGDTAADATADTAASADALRHAAKGGNGQGNDNQGNHAAITFTAAQQPACVLKLPPNPLTAEGLATPFELQAPCQEANAVNSAFAQAVILDPATGALTVYNPLVVDAGTKPLLQPQKPKLPPNAVVGIWFGFNGTTLALTSDNPTTVSRTNCINGLNGSFFGQVASCNAPQFFAAANQSIAKGLLTPPPLGMALDGQPCPTTRDFSVVDMDPSDNVTASYLLAANGQTAQNTPANVAALAKKGLTTTTLFNGSDNALLALHILPALGCTPFQAPDVTGGGATSTVMTSAQALNELSANAFHNFNTVNPNQIALVPSGDEMVLVNGAASSDKMNLYRSMVDQPKNLNASDANYCMGLLNIGAPRIMLDAGMTMNAAPLDPAVGNSLFTFLVGRLQGTMGAGGLNCPQFGVQFPFATTVDGNGVIISAKLP